MGGSFGERALESDTSLRMGSIITRYANPTPPVAT